MALIGNYSVLNKNPGRALGGSTVADSRGAWNKSGANRNRYVGTGDAGFDPKSAVPNGYTPPASWQLAITSGGLSSYTLILGEGDVSAANLAGGKNAVAALSGTGTISNAEAALIVSAVATLAGTGTISAASANAILDAAATLTGSGSVTGALVALGNAVAALTGTGTVTPTIYATGALEADLTPFTELSPQSLAAAVWNSVASAYDDPDTFGGQLGFLYALGHNKVVTDPAAGTYTVYAEDDVTVLYVADLWQDAAGTTPYAGSGAERRDRLA